MIQSDDIAKACLICFCLSFFLPLVECHGLNVRAEVLRPAAHPIATKIDLVHVPPTSLLVAAPLQAPLHSDSLSSQWARPPPQEPLSLTQQIVETPASEHSPWAVPFFSSGLFMVSAILATHFAWQQSRWLVEQKLPMLRKTVEWQMATIGGEEQKSSSLSEDSDSTLTAVPLQRSTYDTLAQAEMWAPGVTYETVLGVLQNRPTPKKLSTFFWAALLCSNVALFGFLEAFGSIILTHPFYKALYFLAHRSVWLVGWLTATRYAQYRGFIDKGTAGWLYVCTAYGTAALVEPLSAILALNGIRGYDFECVLIALTLSCLVTLRHGRTTASGTLLTGVLILWSCWFFSHLHVPASLWMNWQLGLASILYCVGSFADLFRQDSLGPWRQFLAWPSAVYLGFSAIIFEVFKLGFSWPGRIVDWLQLLILAYVPLVTRGVTTNNQTAWVLSYSMTWLAVGMWISQFTFTGKAFVAVPWLVNLLMGILGLGLASWVRSRRQLFELPAVSLMHRAEGPAVGPV
uniref:Uncharacterized protein n=1 Tax=Eutreptiella gymnastica TaxID=73025 RepID=A0A7S1J6S4_9EUGL